MKLSVIIPIYKVEKYLRKCLDSVVKQDLQNVEIILVDDGSVDLCPQICDEYANSYDCIRKTGDWFRQERQAWKYPSAIT